jgi:hypothetical protein
MSMTKDQIKQLIRYRLQEARIYGDPYRTSDEYDLTTDEISALRNMDSKQRMNFALKKIKQSRREKGQCISGGPKCEKPPTGEDGKPGPYCKNHLESFRVARAKLAKKRGSCSRCPNPPIPGKKLCQKCTDELELTRIKALIAGLCIRCKKKPMELNKHGEKMLFCRGCIDAKVAWNKRRKNFKKTWQDYANDVESTVLANKLKSRGIEPK